jgi:hypothetical protein
MSSHVLATYRRLWRDPHALDGYREGWWVAFAGETVVAAAASLAELHRTLSEIGEPEVLIVPVSPDPWSDIRR